MSKYVYSHHISLSSRRITIYNLQTCIKDEQLFQKSENQCITHRMEMVMDLVREPFGATTSNPKPHLWFGNLTSRCSRVKL